MRIGAVCGGFLVGVLAAGGWTAEPPSAAARSVEGAVSELGSPSFETRQAVAAWIAEEGARLERAGRREDLARFVGHLRAAQRSDDPEIRIAARRLLEPFLAGHPKWRWRLRAPANRSCAVEALPEGIFVWSRAVHPLAAGLGFVVGIQAAGAVAADDGGEESPWRLALLDPRGGEPIWEASAAESLSAAAVGESAVAAVGLSPAGETVVRWYDRKTGRLAWEAREAGAEGEAVTGVAVSGASVLTVGQDGGGASVRCFAPAPGGGKPRCVWKIGVGREKGTEALGGFAGLAASATFSALQVVGDRFLVSGPSFVSLRRVADGSAVWTRSAEELGLAAIDEAVLCPEGVALRGRLPSPPVDTDAVAEEEGQGAPAGAAPPAATAAWDEIGKRPTRDDDEKEAGEEVGEEDPPPAARASRTPAAPRPARGAAPVPAPRGQAAVVRALAAPRLGFPGGEGGLSWVGLLDLQAGRLAWKRERDDLPGTVWRIWTTAKGILAGGDHGGDLQGPWWGAVYAFKDGAPAWEIVRETFPRLGFPTPFLTPHGLLVAARPRRMGFVDDEDPLSTPVRLYDVARGSKVWDASLDIHPNEDISLALISDGLVVGSGEGVFVYRLRDADAPPPAE